MSKTILVSAGHSERDPGAVGHGRTEQDLVTQLRDRVAQILKDVGANVIEDGSDGINEPLNRAIQLARTAHVAVEFHFNASSNSSATGIETLAKPKHRVLAKKLCKAVHDATGLHLRGGDGGYKPDNSGQHPRLGFCEAGGLIVELCFISNKKDLDAYLSNFERVARNLAEVLASEVGISLASRPVSTASQPTPEPSRTAPAYYTVKAGDNLTKIAAAHMTGVNDLRVLNGLSSDVIQPKQVLRVK